MQKIQHKTYTKFFSLLLIAILLITGIIPTEIFVLNYADSDPGFRITSAQFKYNGVDLVEAPGTNGPFKSGDTISFTYNWSIDENTAITADNNSIQLILPDVFPLNAETSGQMMDSEGISFGMYNVQNRILTFIFNENAGLQSNVIGGASFNLTFDFEEVIVSEPYVLVLPFSETIQKQYQLIIEPNQSTPSIKKNGNALSGSEIEWTVDVNMNLADSGNLIVFDALDNHLTFDTNDVEIYPITVKADGSYTVSNTAIDPADCTVNYVQSLDTSPHQLSFDIVNSAGGSIPKAYQIKYTTYVDADKIDFSQSSFTYANTGTFNGNSSTAQVTINGGSILSKSEYGSGSSTVNPSNLVWKIVVNDPQYPLKAVRLEDVIPSGLNYESVQILDESDVDITDVLAGVIQFDVPTNKITIDFGDLSKKRTVLITTSVEADYINSLSTSGSNAIIQANFSNTASLFQTQNGLESQKNASHSMTVKFGKGIYKTGSASVGYNGEKYIDWKVYVNLSNVDLGTNQVSDNLDTRQTLPLTEDQISLYPITVDANGNLVESGTELTNYTLTFDDTDPTHQFNIVFPSNITTPFVIKYRSTIDVEDFDKSSFTNTGTIGTGRSYTATVNKSIANTFTKANVDIDSDGKAYDYATKTYDWKITVNPVREAINALEIIDTLSDGLYMTPSQFNSILVKKGSVELNAGVDYAIVSDTSSGKIKGFTINFSGGSANHVVNNNVYTVEYKATIDPDVASINGNLDYSNRVEFNWDTRTDLPVVTTKPSLSALQKYNGSKSGTLDLSQKKINWQINVNYLGKNYDGLVIADPISVDPNGSGLKLESGSIKIYKDTVDASGNLKTIGITEMSESDLAAAQIVITELPDQNSFTVTFNGTIQEPYRITYRTDMVGISSTLYTNTANTNKGESYTATVTHTQGQTFIDKTGARDGQVVNWELIINQSKSTISNLKMIEQLNEGLEIDTASFKLFKGSDELVFNDYFTVKVNDRALSSDPQSFVIEAIVPIVDTFKIKYQTEIITDHIVSNSFSNTVTLEGAYVVSGTTQKTQTISHNIMESNGWAVGQLGSFTMTKVNEQGDPLSGAEFEFYKGTTLLGKLSTDLNGEIHVGKLKYATYTLKEVNAPVGYQIVTASNDILINSTVDKAVTIQNDALRKIEITKYASGTTMPLRGAIFEVKKDNVLVGTLTTDVAGKATLELPYGTYIVTEKTAPYGYTKSSDIVQVVIGKGDKNPDDSLKIVYDITFENERIPNVYIPETTEPTTEPTTEVTSEPIVEGTTESTTQPTTEKTRENEPKEGEVPVPEGGKPGVKTPPDNGKVDIDENGKWTYTPDPGFIGKDQFTVIVSTPEGDEEFTIDIDVEEIPLGTSVPENLPQTGQRSPTLYYGIGFLLMLLGGYLRVILKTKEK